MAKPRRGVKGAMLGNRAKVRWMVTGGCILALLLSCTGSELFSQSNPTPDPSPELIPSPTPTPFQPEVHSPTPSATTTDTPTATSTPRPTVRPDANTLRAYADSIGFGIGTVYQALESRNPLFPPVFSTEFNTVMMTTFMKKTEPMRDRWDWSLTDDVLAQALSNHQMIIGGPLVYDNPTAPAWLLFDQPDCGKWNPSELEGLLRKYIQTVAARFGTQVAGWEVVNEPITSRDNCWRQLLGDQYIDRAFRYAHEANPDALLMLNEAFGWAGVDRSAADQFLALVQRLKASGVPLDAVGIQMHLRAEILRPTYPDEIQYFLDQAREIGVEVWITEMDVYQGGPGNFQNPSEVQKQIYHTVARTCLQSPICTRLIVWGVSDQYTWLAKLTGDDFFDPQPLLFDWQFQRKPAYFGILDALQEAAGGGDP
jgi:endo-1,4-beta-xylanase